jgi:hypothetical protein
LPVISAGGVFATGGVFGIGGAALLCGSVVRYLTVRTTEHGPSASFSVAPTRDGGLVTFGGAF